MSLGKIDYFRCLSEFNRFVHWINEQVSENAAREISVGLPYAGATSLQEKWFVYVNSGDTWRLVWSDPTFTGLFELVVDFRGELTQAFH
jgi:hypothetical protein